MAATRTHGHMAFKVHLPQVIGLLVFKPGERFDEACLRVDTIIAFENGMNRTGCRHGAAAPFKASLDLARPPAGVLDVKRKYLALKFEGGSIWRGMGAARLIIHPVATLTFIAL